MPNIDEHGENSDWYFGLALHTVASRVLPTIEINGSFYSLQYPESYRR